jgi:hypothetical protein
MGVEIVGDPGDIGVVRGPALLHSVALASCGVGRELGSGPLVIVPGPAETPLAVSLSVNGTGDWFLIDRAGAGTHPATQSFVALKKDPRPRARWLFQQFLRGMETLGSAPEPAVMDVLFGAPAAPLTRLAVALRAGRNFSGCRGEPLMRFLVANPDMEPEGPLTTLSPQTHENVEACLRTVEQLSLEDGGRYRVLVDALSEILTHITMLPINGILLPLDSSMDSVAFGLAQALVATQGDSEAQRGLLDTYRFLGGKFTSSASHPIELPADLPPTEQLARWRWFCVHVNEAARRMKTLWRDLMDPPQ